MGASSIGKFYYRGVYDCEFSPDNSVLYIVGQRSHVNTDIFNDQNEDWKNCISAIDLTKSGDAINLSSKIIHIIPNQPSGASLFTNSIIFFNPFIYRLKSL